MSAHVLMNLLNESGKRAFYLFSQQVLFNNTRARKLDSIYHMALR